jgi:sugar O-acyltransferase (sialic acid O-acetyltransferase NeuD family)
MNLPVIILGAGGHAKVLIDTLLLTAVEIAGIVDPDREKHGTSILGIPVIGNDDVVLKKGPGAVMLVNGVGSVKQPALRKQLFDTFKARGFTFASVHHPSAVIAADVLLAEGVQVMAGSVIQPGCVIGRNVIINTKAAVDHDCTIGDHSHVAPGVTLSGSVTVGEGAHIGAGATVLQNVHIGRSSIIGAGAVVLQDVPENVLVYGVPGKVVSK